MRDLVEEYGADRNRFEKESSFCILCGLCVRYCAEVKKKNAISFINRGGKREIAFIPEIAAKNCRDCKECFPPLPHVVSSGSLCFDRGTFLSFLLIGNRGGVTGVQYIF